MELRARLRGLGSARRAVVHFAWSECNDRGRECHLIADATRARFRPQASELGETLKVRVRVAVHGRVAGPRRVTLVTEPTAIVQGRTSIYISEAGSGSDAGTSCGNAKPAAVFNGGAAWGSGAGQIGPGTTVDLCGQIAAPLVFQGSGTSLAPVMLYFEPGASVSAPFCAGRGTGCLDTNGQSFLLIDGGSNGSILSTANGTGLANQNGNVVGLWAEGCNGCTIENLNISDMYVHTSATDTAADTDDGMFVSGSDLTIADNTLHDDDAAINGVWDTTDQNIAIFGNDIYNINGAFNSVVNNESGGSIGPILFYDNTVGNYGNWDTTDDAYHHDGIHCWTSDGGAGAHYNGFYIYDNQFGGTTDLAGSPYGDEMTAQIFLEGSPDGTPCSDNSSNFYIFNNVLTENAFMYNGLIGASSGTVYMYNNTLLGTDTQDGTCAVLNTEVSFENNIVTGCGTLLATHTDGDTSPSTFNANLYAGIGVGFLCGTTALAITDLTQWSQCIGGGDQQSRVVSQLDLSTSGAIAPRAPGSSLGINLSSLCTAQLLPLCRTASGSARPIIGHWPVGAD